MIRFKGDKGYVLIVSFMILYPLFNPASSPAYDILEKKVQPNHHPFVLCSDL